MADRKPARFPKLTRRRQVWRDNQWVDLIGDLVKPGEVMRIVNLDGTPQRPFSMGFVVVIGLDDNGQPTFTLTADGRGKQGAKKESIEPGTEIIDDA